MFGALLLINREVYLPVVYESNIDKFKVSLNTSKPTFDINTSLDYYAEFSTSEGNFTVDLYENNTPENVNNFVYLANLDYYDETKFHRVIPNLLIQGGDRNTLTSDKSSYGEGNPGYFLTDEINLNTLNLTNEQISNRELEGFGGNNNLSSIDIKHYSVAIANTREPDTNGSQFFIVFPNASQSDLNKLNGRFTIIGEIVSGHDVIRKFEQIALTEEEDQYRPTQDITLFNVLIRTI